MKCKQCGQQIISKSGKVFCSQTCSATYNNLHRSKEIHAKQRQTLKQRYKEAPKFKPVWAEDKYKECVVCSKSFVVNSKSRNKKTCSTVCYKKLNSDRATANPLFGGNRSKHIIPYTTKQKSIINLDSSWERDLAVLLDANDIRWDRPGVIWYDQLGRKRKYFPDFHIPSLNIYVDTKNPWRCIQDREKLELVVTQNKINLLVISSNKLITLDTINQPVHGLLIV